MEAIATQTIKKPLNKLNQVIHLLNIADKLNILNDKMFDQLMNKYENNRLMFDFMLENINCCILNKVGIDITKKNFLNLIDTHTYGDLYTNSNIYIPYKDLDYE